MSIHRDHRRRVRQRFIEQGLDSFNEHQVLELLLFYSIPRIDTNEIAHRLMERFGSLAQVIDAPVKELMKIEGIGENSAVFISLLKQLLRYYHVNRSNQNCVLRSIEECGDYLKPRFNGRDYETVFLLCLDAKCKVLSCRLVEEGGVNSAGVSIRKVVDIALTENATSVVLAHNHPSGVALPSPEDVQTTYQIAQALKMVDVVLTDHVVVADNEYVSMVQSNYYAADTVWDEFEQVLR